MGNGLPLWKDWHGGNPSARTLSRWRVRAVQLAKAKGAHTACHLCKRPVLREYRYGRISLRPGNAWRSKAKVRHICHSCFLVLDSLVTEMEILGSRDHLPPEDYADISAEKLAQLEEPQEEKKSVEIL